MHFIPFIIILTFFCGFCNMCVTFFMFLCASYFFVSWCCVSFKETGNSAKTEFMWMWKHSSQCWDTDVLVEKGAKTDNELTVMSEGEDNNGCSSFKTDSACNRHTWITTSNHVNHKQDNIIAHMPRHQPWSTTENHFQYPNSQAAGKVHKSAPLNVHLSRIAGHNTYLHRPAVKVKEVGLV